MRRRQLILIIHRKCPLLLLHSGVFRSMDSGVSIVCNTVIVNNLKYRWASIRFKKIFAEPKDVCVLILVDGTELPSLK